MIRCIFKYLILEFQQGIALNCKIIHNELFSWSLKGKGFIK